MAMKFRWIFANYPRTCIDKQLFERQAKLINVSIKESVCVSNLLAKSPSNFFSIFLMHLNTDKQLLIAMYARSDLQVLHFSLWSLLAIFSARLDCEIYMNFTPSMSFILYVIVLLFSFSFIKIKKIMYFSIYSPKHSKLPFELFRQLFDFEVVVIIIAIMKHDRNFFWCFVS